MVVAAQLPFEQANPLQVAPRLRELQAQGTLHRVLTDVGESALFGGPLGNFTTEHTDHQRLRALIQPHFTPKHMRALRPRIEALAMGLLDELAEHGPPADLHAMLALPLPILVICELLGVPYEDRDQFRRWTDDAGNPATTPVPNVGSSTCSPTASSWSPPNGMNLATT